MDPDDVIAILAQQLGMARRFVPDDEPGSGEFSKEDCDVALELAKEWFETQADG